MPRPQFPNVISAEGYKSYNLQLRLQTYSISKFVSSTRCLQASQLIWSTKPCHSSGKGSHSRPLLDICRRTEEPKTLDSRLSSTAGVIQAAAGGRTAANIVNTLKTLKNGTTELLNVVFLRCVVYCLKMLE